MRKITAFTISLVIVCILSTSCKHKKGGYSISLFGLGKEKNEVSLRIDRFEKDLFASNVESLNPDILKLKAKYGEFFEMFNHRLVNLGDYKDESYPEELRRFLTDYYMNQNIAAVNKEFGDISDISKSLNEAFGNYAKEFPHKKIPHIYTCISGWNQSIVTADTIVGIALDKYLGRNSEFYERLQYERYQRYTLQRNYIAPDVMRAWAYTQFEFKDSASNTVLCNMLYEGKVMYFVKQMLPETEDSILFGYKPSQLKWCKKNEAQMWTVLIEHKLLFSTKYMDSRKLVYPAPFTSFFTNESPGRAAVWIGYQIVSAYMDKHSDISLAQLMQTDDYAKILRESGYKP